MPEETITTTDAHGQAETDTPANPKGAKRANKGGKTERPKSDQPRAKRGPARPHRRLATDVIDQRITKLQKRLDRARSQIEDAARHVEGYLRERDFRAKETVGN